MKPRQTDASVEYSHDAEVIAMEISEKGLPMLLGMLTKMYNDPALAVIREYTTNGIDANIEAGTDKPVDVYLPSELGEPLFIVRDYGPGMNKQEVRDIFSKYVESTKRDSNDFAGMFGIGSKSALAYTNMFTVESIKDGIKTIMTITRTGTAPEIEVKQVKSDQPTGTIVKVPVSDSNSFNFKARKHYKLLAPGLVRVNGEDIGGMFRDREIDFDLAEELYVSNELKTSYVIMGNVPYEIPEEVAYTVDRYGHRDSTRKTSGNFIIHVALGEFMPAPPREGLELNDDDVARLRKMINRADQEYLEVLKEEIRTAGSVMDGMKAYTELNNKSSRYNAFSEEITIDGFTFDGWRIKIPEMIWDSEKNAETTYSQSKNTVRTHTLGNKRIAFFYNADDDISDYYRKKITDWCSHNSHPSNWVGVKKKSHIPTGYPDELIFDFGDVQDWSRPNNGSGGSSSSGKWSVIVKAPYKDNWEKSRVPFDWRNTNKINEGDHGKKELVYVSPSDYDEGVTIGMLQMAIQQDDVVLIKLGKNRWDKMKREYPNAQHIKPWYKDAKDKLIKGFDEEHFRSRPSMVPDLDSDLHRRYNERAELLKKKRDKAVKALGDSQVNMLSTGHDPELAELRNKIEERYPYVPSRIYYKDDREKANTYIAAMDLYYKEKKNG